MVYEAVFFTVYSCKISEYHTDPTPFWRTCTVYCNSYRSLVIVLILNYFYFNSLKANFTVTHD